MNNCLPRDITTDAEGGKAEPATGTPTVRRLIVSMLLTTATLDLTRCGLVMAADRHPAPTVGLVTAGLAAAVLTARTARGCRAGRRWAGWAALLIGLASVPRSEEHTSELQSHSDIVCRLLLEKKKKSLQELLLYKKQKEKKKAK